MNIKTIQLLFSIAHKTIEGHLCGKDYKLSAEDRKQLAEEAGIFVTLNMNGRLRGCIGYTAPVPLYIGANRAAMLAAFSDPRFPPLEPHELGQIEMEISVLTPPVQIKLKNPLDYPQNIEVGKDGLIVEMPHHSGLLLPQVAVEYKWNSQQFLEYTCEKAGLGKDSWKQPGCKVFKFQAHVYEEKDGKVIEQPLS